MTHADECLPQARVEDSAARIASVRCETETLLVLTGELDLVLRDELRAAITSAGNDHLVIDLGAVSFVDVSTITLLATACGERAVAGRRTLLLNAQPAVRRVFVLARAQHLLAA